MEKELLRLLLNYRFYINNKHLLTKDMFPSNLQALYQLICSTQEKLKRDISLGEIKGLYKVEYPTTTQAAWNNLNIILDNLPVEIKEDVAKEILKKAFIIEAGRQIAEIGIGIVNGRETSFSKARTILDKIEQGKLLELDDDLEAVSSDLEDILNAINITTKYPFNIGPLNVVASGCGPGIFSIIFSRPEVGKTAFWVSLAASPGGFCDSGATVFAYVNEEPAQRTQGRAVMAHTGMNLTELLCKPDIASALYAKIKDRIKFFDCKGRDIEEIRGHIKRHKPDIVIIDQLDKLSVKGSFGRNDERLGALYISARDIGADTNSAVFAISQASAEAEGKTYMGSADLAEARTAKAAEGDLVIGIGKSSIHTEKTRILNMVKNKITGKHDEVVTIIHPEISRYTA